MPADTPNHPEDDTGPPELSGLPELYMKTSAGQLVPVQVESGRVADDSSTAQIMIVSTSREVSSTHVGPMPSPETMAAYDQLVPGAAKMLVDEHIADKQHVRATITAQVTNEASGVARGQWIGLGLMVFAIAGAILMGILDHAVLAVAFLSPALILGISRFYAREKQGDADSATNDEKEPGKAITPSGQS